MQPLFLVFAVCAFASGFALRIIDPLVVPIAQHFGVLPATAAMLSTAYALPYAVAQPFLGPIGDRFGKTRCMQVCIVGLALSLLFSAFAPSFGLLLASRVVAGIFAGGLIPLVLAGIGDAFDIEERQVMIGRMLFAIITGQMLGSGVAGFANAAFGWRSALLLAAAIALVATVFTWRSGRRSNLAATPSTTGPRSFRALYGHVFGNPKAKWLYSAIVFEGALVFGVFPYVGQLLIERTGSAVGAAPGQAGIMLGAFGVGGLAYAFAVRRLIGWLGVRRMCIAGSLALAVAYAALVVVPHWWLGAVAMAFAGISYYMLHNSLQTEATEIAPKARGSAVALFACGFFIGQGLGPIVFGALMHALGFAAALLVCVAGFVALGQFVVRRIVA